VAFSCFGRQSVRRWLAVADLGAFVGLLANTMPHGVHHLAEAAHHAPVACQLYALGVGIQMILMLAAIYIGLRPYVPQQGITSALAHLLLKDIPLAAATFCLFVEGGGPYSLDARLGRA